MIFKSGLLNCHLPGIHSLVIEERKNNIEGMRRVFYVSRICEIGKLYRNGDFNLRPHNHRQDLRFTLLFGEASHHLLKFGHGEDLAYCYRFKSALLTGDFEVEKLYSDTINTVEEPITKTPRTLPWSTVHTVTAQPESAWLVEEGELAPAETSRCWSLSPRLKLDTTDLYQPMSARLLSEMQDRINSAVR